MKRQIREKIGNMLGRFLYCTMLFVALSLKCYQKVEITGDENALMQYTNYEEQIVQKYRVELQGWTFDKFVNPSVLSTSLHGLKRLLDAINNGQCKFIKLSHLEVKRRCEELQKKQIEGTVAVKTRKPRADRGIKRSRKKGNKRGEGDEIDDDEEEGEEGEERPRKRTKTTQIVHTETDN